MKKVNKDNDTKEILKDILYLLVDIRYNLKEMRKLLEDKRLALQKNKSLIFDKILLHGDTPREC